MAEQREADAAHGLPRSTPAGSPRQATASTTPEPGGRATEVLLVCTANICRSPVAEAFLRHRLAALGSDVVVHAAGLHSGGRRADPVVVKMLRRRGLRLRGRRSTTLTEQLLSSADLVLGMAVEHVQAVVLMAPEKWPRVFTLKELIRRSDAMGGRRPEETMDDWLARLHSGRNLGELGAFSPQNDISDPLGRSPAAYESMVNEVEALTRRLADSLAGTRDRWSMEPEGMPPISLEWTGTGDRQDSLGQGAEANEDVSHDDDDDDNAEETSMKAEDVNTHGGRATQGLPSLAHPPDDGLRSAQEALQEARQTVMEAAQLLAELLRPAADAQPTVPADAYTQLGDEVAAVMRSAAVQSSAVREDAERYAHRVRSQVEADALALREQSESEASEVRRKAEDESATMRREADAAAKTLTNKAEEQAQRTLREANEQATALRAEAAAERQQAGTEAANLRRAATTESASLRDEADLYAKGTRQQAEADANHIRDEADRYAANVRGVAKVQSTEVRDRAEHDAATMRHAAEEDARTMRWDAEQEAAGIVSEARARYAELVVAEGELRNRLEGAAGALVSALEGRQHVLSAPLALGGSEEEEGGDASGVSDP